MKFVNVLVLALIMLFFSACNLDYYKDKVNNCLEEEPTEILATAQLGNLANADVSIYKIEDDGSFTPLWIEITQAVDSLDEIGKFNAHLDELDDDTFYLYKVKGGSDWDSDDDGALDASATPNKGTISAIAKGSDFKNASSSLRVTLASELVYERVSKYLSNNFDKNSFAHILSDEAKNVITNANTADVLSFNPVSDKESLTPHYKNNFAYYIDVIHQGKIPILNRKIPTINKTTWQLGSFDTARAQAVTLSSDGTKAYVADSDNGLVVLDISDPTNPTLLGLFDTASYALDVTLSSDGTKAYVAANDNGLVVLDITDPANPTQLGSFDTADYAYGVTLSSNGTKAYVAYGGNGLVVLDITDPANPSQLGLIDTNGTAVDITLSNDGTKAYVANIYGVVILDITDAANPTQLGSFDTADYTYSVTLSSDGTKAYVADYDDGLVVLDITDPANPTQFGSFDTAGYTYSVTLSSDGTKAYVANIYGVVILDITDPAHLNELGSFYTAGDAQVVTLSSDGTKAYVADGDNGLVILDISLLND